MTELKDFTDFADGPLVFPIRGKKYTAPEISIELGMRLNGITNHGDEADMESVELFKLMLGPVWDEMVSDGVPMTAAIRAGATMLADFQYGREYATAMWETGADPKAMAEYMKARGNRATRRSNSTGGATKTRSRASTKATTSRKP